ncbi:MAG: 2-succinyl-5-enolpyruvyl-6-hydroxy-3-cyclohexene-1-carboxylic-acid synthase, partial [Bacteroidales bacterium]
AFSCLTEVYDMAPTVFLNSLLRNASGKTQSNYAIYWNERANQLQQAGSLWIQSADYSDLKVIHTLMSRLPMQSFLHLGNSSSVRNAQLCNLDASIRVISNRGVSGIDGIVSTTVGFACETSELVFLFVGDLSFFYDQNGLWNKYVKSNLRIVLMNNGNGGIFHLLPGADKSEAMDGFIACHHQTQAKEWVLSRGFEYLSASDSEQLDEILETFMNKESNKPLFLEVFISAEVNPKVFKSYYHYIKTLNNGN